MIQMGALDDPPAHAMRSLSSALTEERQNVPTNIKATPRKAAYNLRCIFLAVSGAFTGGGCILA
jgi:hypothetical protein